MPTTGAFVGRESRARCPAPIVRLTAESEGATCCKPQQGDDGWTPRWDDAIHAIGAPNGVIEGVGLRDTRPTKPNVTDSTPVGRAVAPAAVTVSVDSPEDRSPIRKPAATPTAPIATAASTKGAVRGPPPTPAAALAPRRLSSRSARLAASPAPRARAASRRRSTISTHSSTRCVTERVVSAASARRSSSLQRPLCGAIPVSSTRWPRRRR
jgi:hypothetical protein